MLNSLAESLRLAADGKPGSLTPGAHFSSILTLVCLLFYPQFAVADSSKLFLVSGQVSAPPSGAVNLCQSYPWACSRNAKDDAVDRQLLQIITDINRLINREIHYISDLTQFKIPEHWALPTSRGGDCEDYALLKKQKLVDIGISPQALLIATVLDKRRKGHAVLVVRTTYGDMVLDIVTNRVLPWADTGYFFLRMQNPNAPEGWVTISTG